MRFIGWANTLPGLPIKNKSMGTGHTGKSFRVPGAWRRANNAEPRLVEKHLVRTATSIVEGIYLIIWALTNIGRAIPVARGVTSYALPGIGIEVRVLRVAQAFRKGSIKSESRGTAFAFLGVFIPMSISGTNIASFSGSIPVHWLGTGNANVAGCKMRPICRTTTLPSGLVEIHPWRAVNAFILLAIPDSWRVAAHTEPRSVYMSEIRRALASL
jgi:hypothetical protein